MHQSIVDLLSYLGKHADTRLIRTAANLVTVHEAALELSARLPGGEASDRLLLALGGVDPSFNERGIDEQTPGCD